MILLRSRLHPGALPCSLCLFLLFLPIALVPFVSAHQAQPSSPGRIRSMAESQHEIVMLLMRKKDFSQAAVEAHKIFAMDWPVDEEPLLLKELLYLSDQFSHQGQAALAVELLKDNIKAFKTAKSRVAILKEQGYVYKNLNQNDKALDCFREAQRLEKQLP